MPVCIPKRTNELNFQIEGGTIRALTVVGRAVRTCSKMKTDKELYRIFDVAPEWVFELAGLPSPGKSTLRSMTVKALERRADGVIVPEAPDQPVTIVEFQFQADDRIYGRTVVEMVAVQDAFPGRVVQGIIFFG